MSKKIYVIKCCKTFVVDNYSNIQEVYDNLGCANARLQYFIAAGLPKETFKIYTYELKEADK